MAQTSVCIYDTQAYSPLLFMYCLSPGSYNPANPFSIPCKGLPLPDEQVEAIDGAIGF